MARAKPVLAGVMPPEFEVIEEEPVVPVSRDDKDSTLHEERTWIDVGCYSCGHVGHIAEPDWSAHTVAVEKMVDATLPDGTVLGVRATVEEPTRAVRFECNQCRAVNVVEVPE